MTSDELRALTAQGPAIVMVSRDDMLKLLDELEAERALRIQLERQRNEANAYGDEEHARRLLVEAQLATLRKAEEAEQDG
jgi:hypothetical protein